MQSKLRYKIVTGPAAIDIVARIISAGQKALFDAKAIDVFLKFIARYAIDVSRQPVAQIDDQIVAYGLCLVNPGATGNVFLPDDFPQLPGEYDFPTVAAGVLTFLAEKIDPWNLAFLQTMVCDENSPTCQIFQKAGFSPLCRLMTMQTNVPPPTQPENSGFHEWVQYNQSTRERFAAVILQSYEGSIDCPRLTGLRTGQEILTGHYHSGLFEPQGWWILHHNHRDAGVLMLNGTEENPRLLEIVYMGLTPQSRGTGLGQILLHHAFDVCRRLGKNTLRLAVDCDNTPAIKLYRKFGFQEIGYQTVMAVLNENRRRNY
ncbi:MAG: GNAT family N-acetyltransferase [Phycisphaerae bacterium]